MTPETIAVYLGLGSNLGDRDANLKRALDLLAAELDPGPVSSTYETEPMGVGDQPPFLNLACAVSTSLEPHALLRLTQGIELEMGRAPHSHNQPRPIDIDILLYGDRVVEAEDLIIPHPRMHERAFVLVPLAEIAPDAVHPVSGRTVRQMLAGVPGPEGVARWTKR